MNKRNLDHYKILSVIKFLNEKEKLRDNEKKWKRVTEVDLFGKVKNKKKVINPKKNGEKVSAFRMQEEFGPKKRIKP
jgi:hypothetical protein